MGKPYASELASLPETYAWAMQVDVDALARALSAAASLPLIAVGSGGSLTAAHLASWLHQRYAGAVARASTPFDAVSTLSTPTNAAVLFLSARGRNGDILGAFGRTIAREPQRIIVVCLSPQSPLSKLAQMYRYVDLIDLSFPSRRDGFLATNSLVAFSVLLARAYMRTSSNEGDLPSDIRDLLHPNRSVTEFADGLRASCLPLWTRETLVVLHGAVTSAAAIDLESKFTEAALGPVQTADYRNFAHGRHHWLAKRGDSTAVLAFVTKEDRCIADRTLALIPSDIPICKIELPFDGVPTALAALVSALHVVGLAGEARGIDPGRPGVPAFGRKIYHLRAGPKPPSCVQVSSPLEGIAIVRKTRLSIDALLKQGQLQFWRDAFKAFVQRLEATTFRAVVFDYDGTLCGTHDRFHGPSDEIIQRLLGLLAAGVVVGIATGRGKSVREHLRRKINRSLWQQVVVGYYNGSEIGSLVEDSCPERVETPCDDLLLIADLLRSDARLNGISKCTYRRTQITVEPVVPTADASVWETIQHIVHVQDSWGIKVLRSGHSIDILAPNVSKRALVTWIEKSVESNQAADVLCIGDRGRWPGNDFEFLTGPYSLSVDEVSPDPSTCWNLAFPGCRGVQATTEYFDHLEECPAGRVRFRLSREKGA